MMSYIIKNRLRYDHQRNVSRISCSCARSLSNKCLCCFFAVTKGEKMTPRVERVQLAQLTQPAQLAQLAQLAQPPCRIAIKNTTSTA